MTEVNEKLVKEEVDEDNLCSDAAARLTFEIALEIAKTSCSYAEGEFIKKCLLIAAGQLCPPQVRTFKTINLSNKIIKRCIDLMVCNVKKQIRIICTSFITYSLAVNQYICLSGIPYIAIFIRGVNSNLHVTEELLDLVPVDDMIAENILSSVNKTLQNNDLKWERLVSITTNGSSMMTEDKIGFMSLVNGKMREIGSSNNVIAVHSLMLMHNLCAKSDVILNVMSTIVNIVCYIRNHEIKLQEFHALVEELDSDYESSRVIELPNYTEVEWLNRGTVLEKFFNIHEIIRDFMELTGQSVPQLKDTQWLIDLAFLADLATHLNNLNLLLQEEGQIIVQLYDSICAFQMKIQLWIKQLQMGNPYHFPKLKLAPLTEDCVKRLCTILQILLEEIETRFKDIQDLDTSFNIYTMPFTVNVNTVPSELLLELLDMRCDRKVKVKGGSLIEFYENFSYIRFPQLHNLAARTLCMFGSTRFCEQLILNMKKIKSAYRTGIIGYDYIFKCSLILNSCRKIRPNINQLLRERKL
ncbi:general transcription factor II-I repeat domain-containing protein 2-like isoform X1 [Osmia bicornis bicornis]|uniref:general transcription factor II-I repeat domain-containing protein 2-like isoform X1 n=1 Tax=Osmia bicornis bicornis TaxID=1437191 RepID=UPI0010F98E26|nr:general transcription factor II-I repeat domain-containing protein 2-like isoform X1 [Osmia bicornis bicornis]XP_029043252.1 general transcription factor II-I repeat domain-containing protein 2-like isoform X1 [Osmia bicornis bicornis]